MWGHYNRKTNAYFGAKEDISSKFLYHQSKNPYPRKHEICVSAILFFGRLGIIDFSMVFVGEP